MAMNEFLKQDLFFLDLDDDVIEWVYYNPDAASGGQFVVNIFNQELLEEAVDDAMDVEAIFEYIEDNCSRYLAANGTALFSHVWKRMENGEPFSEGCSLMTVDNLYLAYLAKEYLNAYCQREFKMDAEFADLRKIAIGYTTITDAEHDVQVYANLMDYRIELYLNDRIAEFVQCDSLMDMVHNTLPELEFDDLIYIPDWVIENHERVAAIDSLAARINFFIKEFNPHEYAYMVEVGDTDADMISKMRADITDTEIIPEIIAELKNIVYGSKLTDGEREKGYDLMTELYHLYVEKEYGPVYDRETEVLAVATKALGLSDCEIVFDSEGICLTRGDEKWYNGDIYQYLANGITREGWYNFRRHFFSAYTDFKDMAEHYGVQVGKQLKAAPIARIDFLSPQGNVGESIDFTTESDFLNYLKGYLEYGVPLAVVLYRDKEGKTISRDFLMDLDTPPKSVTVEDLRTQSKEDRGAVR